MSKQRSEVLIRVTDDALIVANDGRPVSRLGVLALCASDLSEKSGREDEKPEDYPHTPDKELLQAIANSAIGVYRADPNRPKRDCVSAWNKDPRFGVIGIQSGPRDKGPQWLPSSHGSRGWDAGGGDDW
uniref:Uncharacterized protein n=1 Tax=Bradyrhizobium quebecense TaxID=2748629 RepID=A0A974AKB8_9BRAD